MAVRFSGTALDGETVTMSVNGGAAVTAATWGGGGGGGPITVSAVDRSLRQIAPDSVIFEVDLSSSNFDTAGPTGSEVYDARMHDLVYLWDMGDPGTWTEPVNVLTAWKNRNVAKGPKVSHVYRAAGTYTASVLVIEPSSGKTATASVTFDVDDPQDFYGDANTIYVNNVGDSDFSDVPAGVPSGNKVNIDSLTQIGNSGVFTPDATWSNFKGTARRWRFKRGGEWEISIYAHSADGIDMMFDDYGDAGEPNPIWKTIETPTVDERVMVQFGYAHDSTVDRDASLIPPEWRIRNIDARGLYDPTTTYVQSPSNDYETFFAGVGAHRVTICDCTMDGFGANICVVQADTSNTISKVSHLHMDNCGMSNFGGEYQVSAFNGARAGSSVSLTGCRWEQPGDAIASSASGQETRIGSRSPARISTAPFVHIRGCDTFITEASLTHFQLGKTAYDDGYLFNIHSCSAEGGSAFCDTDGRYDNTPQARSHVHNMIVDGIVYVGIWNTYCGFAINSTGVTIRNNLVIIPAVPKYGNSVSGMVEVKSLIVSGTMPDYVADAPVSIYNNTFRVDRNQSQNLNWLFDIISPHGTYTDFNAVTEANNVFHVPNLTISGNPDYPATDSAPVSDTALWTPRCLGRRDPFTIALDTTYATPTDAVRETRPLTGSAAIGAALNGDVAYDSLGSSGVARADPPSKGAYEPA